MIRKLPVLILLFTLWVCLSGIFTPLLLALGLFSSIAVVWLGTSLSTFSPNSQTLRTSLRLYRYIPWLLVEIVKSNIMVAGTILGPSSRVNSKVVYRYTTQKSDIGRTIHANSITLTPGTISMDIDADKITVHALTSQTANGVIQDTMDLRVSGLENSA